MLLRYLIGGFLLIVALPAAMADEADITNVRQGIAKLLPGVELDRVEATPVPGLYEAAIGPRLFYVSADGRYLLQGHIFDIDTKQDLTEPKITGAKRQAIEEMGEENMVIFAPDKFEHTVTVFTDIDCGYCRKLHSEMKDYNDKGIRVRYMFFPRAGLNSESYQKAVSVWCSEDRNGAMTEAKKGAKMQSKECDNPVSKELQLGQLLGVTGTPAIFLESGDMLPGYIPPDKLSAFLKKK